VQWTVHGERVVYASPWVSLTLVDVEVPGGERFEHHVVRSRHASGVVVHDPDRGVLLIHRHRFITDTWGWEIPAGAIEEGESPEDAARREVLEETGWEIGAVEPLGSYHPVNGLADVTFNLFLARGAVHRGEPLDRSEADAVEWLPLEQVRELVRTGQVRDGMSLTGLLHALAFARL
jgi:8-oxo-dGTP pyrophosphatase MutT (NUDIX family)